MPKPYTAIKMRESHILNLGAGVQSTALYLMFMRGEIQPRIDYAIFADTQDEPKAVYRHLEWLQSLNGPPILVRTKGKLSDDLMTGIRRNGLYTRDGTRFASIPAFTLGDNGEPGGMTRRQCSKEYKIEVIERVIRQEILGLQPRQRVPKGILIRQYYGISFDEGGRARRIQENWHLKGNWKPAFPLIDNFVTRANCLTYLADKVPHETPRSACVFCPYHTDFEWDRIKREDPEGWRAAVATDAGLRAHDSRVNQGMDRPMFVHRSCKPLDLVELDTRPDPRKAQLSINFSSECLGVCGV
ncbi:MAG TPA: hypothetical protein VFO46_02390 [Candidatus Sulfotelmatobacter sp.]|nr:hypothetical protein [Candidatus Sulfotelmatobacter sp.]